MSATKSIQSNLYDKLDEFISKYYLNELIKGINQFLIVAVSVFLIVSALEYFGRFNSVVRLVLFYGFILSSGWMLLTKVFTPMLKMFGVIKRMSYENAARIIGNHFVEVDDKLLNTIQLAENNLNNDLLLASINQRIQDLKPFDFKLAISKEELKKYFIRLAPVLLVLIALSYLNPKILTEGSERVIQYNTFFAVPAPFDFVLEDTKLSVAQNEDLTVHLHLKGDEIPNEAHIKINGFLYRMKKESNTRYSYTFKSLQKDQAFSFDAGGFNSDSYLINTFPSPKISDFDVKINYPAYTNREADTFENTGDFIVPVGSFLTWSFRGKNCDKIVMVFDSLDQELQQEEDKFSLSKQVLRSVKYFVNTENKFLKRENNLSYKIEVIPDELPQINVIQDENETSFYSGSISDDYGFTALYFIIEKEGEIIKKEPLNFEKSLAQSFFHQFDVNSIDLEEGEDYSYYFIVYDNDAISGYKSSSSKKFIYKAPSRSEIKDAVEEKSSSVKNDAQKAMQELKQIQKDINDFQKSLTEKNKLTWEDKNKLKDILEKQKNLEDQIKEMSQKNKDKNELTDQLSEKEEELLKKQQELEKLFEEVFDEETKKLMEEIEKMMEQLNKDKLEDMMKQMEISNEDMEKELDRSLELFKQLEFELKMEETIQELEKLAQEQEKLAKETENSKKQDKEGLQEKQEELNKKFEEVQKSMEELKEKNEQLEEKYPMDEMKEEQENVQQEQEQAQENLDNNKQKKASENQKKAADEMKKMAMQMKKQMQEEQQKQQTENMDDMRALLDNLIGLSHQQEDLQERLLTTRHNDPKYPQIKLEQSNIRDEAKIIEDSLYALSKRVIQLESTINKEMAQINRNLQETLNNLTANKKGDASKNQQLVMTSLNNLALIMDDVLQQMQEQMKQQKFGEQSCSKPGSNNKPSKSQMQKQLNEQMKQLQEQMGKSPDGQQEGEQKGNQNGEMNQKIAKLAAEQAAIREELQRLKKELEQKKAGQGQVDNVEKAIEEIEKTERDLYNKNISPELLQRQQEILTRLLEAEEAEREQDWDDKRESEEGENEENSNPEEFLEYKKLREKELEQLKTVPLNMKPYFKRKASEYLNVNE